MAIIKQPVTALTEKIIRLDNGDFVEEIAKGPTPPPCKKDHEFSLTFKINENLHTTLWDMAASLADHNAAMNDQNKEFWTRLAGSLRKADKLT